MKTKPTGNEAKLVGYAGSQEQLEIRLAERGDHWPGFDQHEFPMKAGYWIGTDRNRDWVSETREGVEDYIINELHLHRGDCSAIVRWV